MATNTVIYSFMYIATNTVIYIVTYIATNIVIYIVTYTYIDMKYKGFAIRESLFVFLNHVIHLFYVNQLR